MSGLLTSDSDGGRISAVAALTALAGHAAVILVVLLLAGPTREILVPTVVAVTLVSSGGGGPPASSTSQAHNDIASVPVETAAARYFAPSGELLDRLTAPVTAPASVAEPSATRPSPASAMALAVGGFSHANQGLGEGEGAEGVDLYAAASLPAVGARPSPPPTGDLWQRVQPCWRAVAPRVATLMVEVRDDGGLVRAPQAVRKTTASADSQTRLAERAAARALQACAPYTGLSARRWRVRFPALG